MRQQGLDTSLCCRGVYPAAHRKALTLLQDSGVFYDHVGAAEDSLDSSWILVIDVGFEKFLLVTRS